mgnify:CR=1 FL=1
MSHRRGRGPSVVNVIPRMNPSRRRISNAFLAWLVLVSGHAGLIAVSFLTPIYCQCSLFDSQLVRVTAADGKFMICYSTFDDPASPYGVVQAIREFLVGKPRMQCATQFTFSFLRQKPFQLPAGPGGRYDFGATKPTGVLTVHLTQIVFPLWAALVALLVPGGLLASRLYGYHRRSRENACLGCGYSLLQNRSGVCPECGTLIPVEQRKKLQRLESPHKSLPPAL